MVRNSMLNIIEKMTETPLVFDGAMGTVIYEKGVFINACFDELNLTNQKMIKEIHQEYIDAGCDVILTNTFGANKFKLEKYGLADKIYDINFQGAKIAKEIAQDKVYVLGSVGPCLAKGTVLTDENIGELKESYDIQIRALKDGGVDGIMFESHHNLEELDVAAQIAKSYNLPVIASLSSKKE